MHMPTEDKSYASKHDMLNDLVVLLGGRVAEAIALGDISTGASNDIERATKLARDMVTKFGMSELLGPVSFSTGSDEIFLGRDYNHLQNYSESIASTIDNEINGLINNAYDRANTLLHEHTDKLNIIAQYLLENEKIDGEKFLELMNLETTAQNQNGELER